MRRLLFILLPLLAACTPLEHQVWLEWYSTEPEAATDYAIAYVEAVRVNPPPAPEPEPEYSVWDRLAQCESGGDWSINTGNGFYGGLQFSLTSWRGVGGTGYPHQHSRAEQIHRAEKLKAIQGWGAWPGCSRKLGLR